MKKRTYSRGILLWVDDNFLEKDFQQCQQDTNRWREVFGDIENRVYRLLGLKLVVATNLKDAKAYLNELQNKHYFDTYIVAVVDLHIPKSVSVDYGLLKSGASGEKKTNQVKAPLPELKHGIQLAKVLRALDIPFYFLSSMSRAAKDLRDDHLETIPYFTKADEGDFMMPETLARAILNDFRDSVSWLNLQPYLSRTSIEFKSGSGSSIESLSYFPFFAGFRDFVERWEYRPIFDRSATFMLRCPEAHCDAFVMQCMMVAWAHRISARRFDTKINIRYFNCHKKESVDSFMDFLRDKEVKRDNRSNTAIIVRVNEESVMTPEQFLYAVRGCRDVLSAFVVPADQSAELYLEQLPYSSRIIYDNLPFTHWSDKASRESLINKSCQFAYQNVMINQADTSKPLHHVFLSNPEMLIHPCHWHFLLDADSVLEDISDPAEIIKVFTDSATQLSDVSSDVVDANARVNLVEGRPIDPKFLIRIAKETFDRAAIHLQAKWHKAALISWLGNAWQYPYGNSDCFEELDEQSKYLWEEFSVKVLVGLAADVKEKDLNKELEMDRHVIAVKAFLNQTAVYKLIMGEKIIEEDWQGLESIRWPHLHFPMPVALNRLLKGGKKHLWVQTDFLDNATAFPSGRRVHRTLETYADYAHVRIKWIKSTISVLPNSWQGPVRELCQLIDAQLNANDITDQEVKNKIWLQFKALLRNSCPISFIFSYIIQNKTLSSLKKEEKAADDELSKAHGYGKLLGHVRGGRQEIIGKTLKVRLSDYDSNLKVRSLELQQYAQIAKYLYKYNSQDGIGEFFAQLSSNMVDALTNSNSDINESLMTFLSSDELKLHKNDWYFFDKLKGDIEKVQHNDKAKAKPLINRKGEYAATTDFSSLFGTRLDFMWKLLDASQLIRNQTLGLRYFDGYHFLAALNELRVAYKDSTPKYSIDDLLELFVWSFEGIVAQLKFCLEIAGHKELAETITLETVELSSTIQPTKARKSDIQKLMKVVGEQGNYDVYTLGVPGEETADQFSTDDGTGETKVIE